MCVGCLVTSALMLFTPVSEAPQPVSAPAANPDVAVYATVNDDLSLAEQTQIAIADMLSRLPDSPDYRVLHQGLRTFQVRLMDVRDDAEAQQIIDEETRSLNVQMMTAPNYDQLLEAMNTIMEEKDNELLMEQPNINGQQQNSGFTTGAATEQLKRWGWLA